MYRILVKAGNGLTKDATVTIDGIGIATVGHWRIVTDDEAEAFRISHPSGARPTLPEAFADSEVVLVEDYVAPVVPEKEEAPAATVPAEKKEKS